MEECVQNRALLGWLFDPKEENGYVYRPGLAVERLENPVKISADPVLPAFSFDPGEIWERRPQRPLP